MSGLSSCQFPHWQDCLYSIYLKIYVPFWSCSIVRETSHDSWDHKAGLYPPGSEEGSQCPLEC